MSIFVEKAKSNIKAISVFIIMLLLLPFICSNSLNAQTVVMQPSDAVIPTLQEVTDKGNITTNDIQFTNTTEYIGSDDAGDIDIYADDTIDLHAPLVLTPGSPAAGEAPLLFLEGPLLDTPKAGAMEFDGTGVYLTPVNHRRFISQASDSIITTSTATTIANTVVWTGTLNANELLPYRVYSIKARGLINNLNAAALATITVNINGTTIASIVTPSVKLTNDAWMADIDLTIRSIGASGTFSSFGMLMVKTTNTHICIESSAIDTTIVNNMSVNVTWSAENAANWLKLTQCWLAVAD